VVLLAAKQAEIIPQSTRDRAFRLLQDLAAELRESGLAEVEPPYEAMVEVIEDMRSSIEGLGDPLVSWTVLSSRDEYEYLHPFDVAVFSMTTAIYMGNNARITDIGLGGLLHDIGMALIRVPWDYREGEGLTPEEFALFRSHPELGVRVLRQHPRVSAFAKAIVAQHHECMNGSGFPRGLHGPDIHMYSRIVACADAYSSMLSRSRIERDVTPAEVVDYMMSAAGFEFDKDVVRAMLSCVSPFPEGSLVRLSTGELAAVVKQSRGLLVRPVVRLVREDRGRLQETSSEIDLRQPEHQTRLIVDIV